MNEPEKIWASRNPRFSGPGRARENSQSTARKPSRMIVSVSSDT